MSIWRSIITLAALQCLLLASIAGAQTNPRSPESIEAAKALMAAMGQDKQFDTVIGTMMQGMSNIFKQRNPGAAKEIDDVMQSMARKFMARKSEVVDMVAPLVADRFTVAEMNEIAAFYRSPIGQKFVVEQLGIGQKSMMLGMEWGRRIGEEVEAEARRELKQRGVDL
jgi:hypothetical protein